MPISRNNLKPVDGVSFETANNISTGKDDIDVFPLVGNDNRREIVWYTGSGAITEANYAGLNLGALVIDTQAPALKVKTAAAGTATFVDVALT